MKKILLAASAFVLMGTLAAGQANAWNSSLKAKVGLEGSSTSIGAGGSASGGATTTTSGTSFGGSASNGRVDATHETNGPSLSDGTVRASKASGAVSGSTYQTSTTNGAGLAGSYSHSGVLVCSGSAC